MSNDVKSMNLGDSARRSEWPECTRGTLVTLGLWLHSQAHIVKSIGIPGAEGISQVYSDLAARIDIFIEEGPESLDTAFEAATRKATAFSQVFGSTEMRNSK